MRCVVAGGGISGLAVAHALVARGIDTIVFEADARPGGKVRSEWKDGYLCEHGPVGIMGRNHETRALLRDLDLETRLVPASPSAKKRSILHHGELVALPSDPISFVRSPLLSATAKLRILADLVLPRGPAAHGVEESVASFARRRFGDAASDRLFAPLVAGMCAGDAERLSVSSSLPMLAEIERKDRSVILGGARKLRAGPRPQLETVAGGMEQIPRAIARKLGGKLRLGVEVRHVERTSRGFRLGILDHGHLGAVQADAVVLAVPGYATATALGILDPAAAAAAAAVPYAPVALVYAAWHRGDLGIDPEAYGFLAARSEPSWLLGALYASSCWPDSAPGGRVLVSARLGGALLPSVAALPDREIAELATEELTHVLHARAKPHFVHVVRHERALPQYVIGHAGRTAAVDEAERRNPGLFVTGNAFRGLALPDCIAASAHVADRVAAHLAVARSPQPVALHVMS
jgi:oxygen-dependent protoporphyrinogen oxidase